MSSSARHARNPFGRWLARGCLGLAVLVGLARGALAETPSDALLNRLQPRGAVSDFAGVLSEADRQAIKQRIDALEQKNGAQVRVVTLDTLQGGEINDFTNKLFKRWGVGDKGKNNGLLLLVAIKDHKARIEVGYGLEPILPDALAGRVLDDQLFPAFKQGKYGEGLRAAVNRIGEIIERGEKASEADRRPAVKLISPGEQIKMTFFFALFVGTGFMMVGGGIGSKTAGPILFGLFFGGVPMLIAIALAGIFAKVVLPLLAMGALWAGYQAGRNNPDSFGHPASRRGRRPISTSGWAWGNSSGGGWSSGGGGFSSGGFSSGGFGGGSSGGGGASGSW